MTDQNKLLWYKEPAKNWNEALPIGNGRLGGMVFGQVTKEKVQLNEDTVWYGGPRDRINPDALPNLSKVRELLSQGKLTEAEELAKLCFSGIPKSQRHYEPLGELIIQFNNADTTDYYRELDLNNGIVKTKYRSEGIEFQREVFTSYPDQVMIMRITASEENAISLQANIDRGNTRNLDSTKPLFSNSIVMNGETGGRDGIAFSAAMRVSADDGIVQTLGNRICVNNASAVTILLSAATTYRFPDPEKRCLNIIASAENKSYQDLKSAHIRDYQSLFHRVELELEDQLRITSLPINERLERMKQGETDIDLINIYFHFGRYLMIASSRPNSLPATLQGIWNDNMLPPWDSKYTININAQMNYWPAEVCNLSECHEPLFHQIEKMRESGRLTAQKMYDCRGFTAHHNTDIWGDTAPQDIYPPASYWPMGAAWLCLHLWEHYEYNVDKEFLAKAYEAMKEAAIFFVDFLVENQDGYMITTPSVSPENSYKLPSGEIGKMCEAPAMDSQILHALFSNCIAASEVLETDKEFRDQLLYLRSKLPEIQIGKYGQIQEWLEDYEEAEPGHRHISHLFAVHPSNQISPITTPKLAKAAEVTLNRRLEHGGGHTGWSRAWIINMWARLFKGEDAYENIKELLKTSTLPNLFDNHPPFQIDGNFGGTAAIVEMIVQSHQNEIHLLPALPKDWRTGYVKGLKVRGGFTLEIKWQDHQLMYVHIKASQSRICRLRMSHPFKVSIDKGEISQLETGLLEFDVKKDHLYQLTFNTK
ncbi:glycoside hydrolase family 95 protein [Gracilibacillus suaedae]|uniref:glycoside hydrolase family 95 protein n=1 Tax=Gracilibacillus suaedae TaxID=2820273 RepID=UPI001ABDCEC1|nr:glycoside hydrolase family 95 protein [Gracilibacillus suaedae]